jgi:TetR/AcrR family transcriptional regulator, ethionamide resistance regulator
VRSQTDRRPPQRSDHRREAILGALDACLQESSLEAINIAEISKQAGVTRSAFYFYFENKGAAVAALMERMVDETFAVNELFTTGAESPHTRIRTMLTGLFAMWERHRHLFQAMLEVRGSSPSVREIWDTARESFVDSIADMIRSERASAPCGAAPDAAVLATVLLEFNGQLLERLTLGGPLTAAQLMDGATAVWLGTVYGITDIGQEQS